MSDEKQGQERRSYSEQDRADALTALALNDGNVLRTARQLGIADSTLRRFIEAAEDRPSLRVMRDRKKSDLAAKWEALANKAVDRARELVDNASFRDASWTAAVATDKVQLLKGQPTQRVEHNHTLLLEAYMQMRAILPLEEARGVMAEVFELDAEDVKRLDGLEDDERDAEEGTPRLFRAPEG